MYVIFVYAPNIGNLNINLKVYYVLRTPIREKIRRKEYFPHSVYNVTLRYEKQ